MYNDEIYEPLKEQSLEKYFGIIGDSIDYIDYIYNKLTNIFKVIIICICFIILIIPNIKRKYFHLYDKNTDGKNYL